MYKLYIIMYVCDMTYILYKLLILTRDTSTVTSLCSQYKLINEL